MTAVDVLLWSLAAIAIATAGGFVFVLGILAARFMEEQRSNLAAHHARKAREIAQAKAAEQRAELEAADILERRLVLPFGGTTSLGEQLAAKDDELSRRLDGAAEVVMRTRRDQDSVVDQLATLSRRVDMLQERPARVTHTDQPLSPRQAAADAWNRGERQR